MSEDQEPQNGEEEYMDAEETRDFEQEAEAFKARGNIAYKKKDYYSALKLYTNAINLVPNKAPLYGNRSAAYIMINNYPSALQDANKSVDLDPTFTKGTVRVMKCYIAMGNIMAASRTLELLKTRDPANSATYAIETSNINQLREFEISSDKDMSNGDFRKVVYIMDRALDIAPACIQYKVRRAECLACLGRYNEAQEAANEMLRSNNLNAGALYVKGLCLFYQDNIDKARRHFLQVLRVDPDHAKAKLAVKRAKELESTKQKGNAAFTGGNNEEALKLYGEALLIDPNNKITNAKLHCNIAACKMKLKQFQDAVQSCNKAIEFDSTYIKAYIRRASCHQELENHEEAVRDCEKIHKMDHSRESKQRLRDANIKLKMSQRKDYYKILGLSKTASLEEIKKGYKKSALKYHPDRHAEEGKEAAEHKFKEVGEAYAVLSDVNKKGRYDNGEDLDDPTGGMRDVDPTHIFETMFGGGGGGGSQFFSAGPAHGRGGHPGFTFSFG